MSPENRSDHSRKYQQDLLERYEITNTVLPRLSEDEFSRVQQESARKEIGLESFLLDFALSAEKRYRDVKRWVIGRKISPVSSEHEAEIISALPSYVIADREAMGAMEIEEAKSFRLDIVVEDIFSEVAQRLPRTIDAYRYYQEYADDILNLPMLDGLKIRMFQTGDGIFSMLQEVEGENFSIRNCRRSGVKYMNRYNDISRPNIIVIKDKKFGKARTIKVGLFDDDSRVHLELNGMLISDEKRVGALEKDVIVWLAKNVLYPLRKAEKPQIQDTIKPEEEAFPEDKFGPLYSFVREEDLIKVALIKDNPSKAYPDERKAIRPGRRLLSLGTPLSGVSSVVHDGFVWCGVGEVNQETLLNPNMEIGKTYRHSDFLGRDGIAVIKPKTATDIYVVDWQAKTNLRNQFAEKATSEGRNEYTDKELIEIDLSIAKTIVPVTEYKGDYAQPIVLIGRNVELDEIENVFLPLNPK